MLLALINLLGGVRAAVFAGLMVVCAGTATFYKLEVNHYKHEIQTASQKAEKAAAALATNRATVTIQTVTRYVDRIKVIHEKGKEIVKEVPIFVPSTLPVLPPSFRVFFDASVLGIVPDPAGIADAAPVSPQDVARTTADDFTICRANSQQLVDLQQWIKDEQAVTK